MKSISFDNPYLLLVVIPLIAATLVPYILAFRKAKKGKGTVISFIAHIVLSVIVTLALAGMTVTTVMTETNVYVLADVSYSSNRSLDKIDSYIKELSGSLPRNSKMGVVCFGADQDVLVEMGGELSGVEGAEVDDSATDISSAINYTAGLFDEDVIKRIVLITDGKETGDNSAPKLISAIENLHNEGIYLDVIYVDNNLSEEDTEIQISGVDYTQSVYLNHESVASVLVNSTYDTQAVMKIIRNGEELENKAVVLTKGYNIVNLNLETATSGEFDYELAIEADGDVSPYNNSYIFTQTVNEGLKVLLLTDSKADENRARALYGESAEIDVYHTKDDVPASAEALCKYDEILISGVDVREMHNGTAFVEAVECAVSIFGKSLVTFGDLQIQNKTDETLEMLSDILPVKFGNSGGDPKLYTIIIDTSRSMFQASRFANTKSAAMKLIDILGEDDYVALVSFSGTITLTQPTRASEANVLELKEYIAGLQPTQGTFLGAAINEALEMIDNLSFSEKQAMLISDGMSYSLEEVDAIEAAGKMYDAGITVSVIDPYVNNEIGTNTLKGIANAGGGEYYYLSGPDASLDDLIFAEIADDVTHTVIEEPSAVYIAMDTDSAVSGVLSLPYINGYINSRAKSGATVVLTVDFNKNESTTVKVPLYSYWTYGVGRVASFSSTLTGAWSEPWQESDSAGIFLENILVSNTPERRVDYPYSMSVTLDGVGADVEIIPATLNPYAEAFINITLPDGSVISDRMLFDSKSYYYDFPTAATGKYSVNISYEPNGEKYEANYTFSLSYEAEYDAFAVFNSSALYTAVRDRGSVYEDIVPKIVNNEDDVATYEIELAMPLLIASIIGYVADIIIRKLRIEDIKSFFKRKKKGAVNDGKAQ